MPATRSNTCRPVDQLRGGQDAERELWESSGLEDVLGTDARYAHSLEDETLGEESPAQDVGAVAPGVLHDRSESGGSHHSVPIATRHGQDGSRYESPSP